MSNKRKSQRNGKGQRDKHRQTAHKISSILSCASNIIVSLVSSTFSVKITKLYGAVLVIFLIFIYLFFSVNLFLCIYKVRIFLSIYLFFIYLFIYLFVFIYFFRADSMTMHSYLRLCLSIGTAVCVVVGYCIIVSNIYNGTSIRDYMIHIPKKNYILKYLERNLYE